MQRANSLNGADFTSSSYAAEALRRLNTDNWTGFELRDLHYAFGALETAFRYISQKPQSPRFRPRVVGASRVSARARGCVRVHQRALFQGQARLRVPLRQSA